MLRPTLGSIAASLLLTASIAPTHNVALGGLIRRHEHSDGLPSYLQSEWHTKNLPRAAMTPEEAMAYYFPHIKRTDDCPPNAGYGGGHGGGSNPGNGGNGGGSNPGSGGGSIPSSGNGGGGTTPPPGNGGNGTTPPPDNGGDGPSVPEPVPGNWSLRNFNTVSSVYNLTVFPKNIPLFLNQTDFGLPFFNQNVTGRVTPLGDFSGYEDSIEYFWGLAPVPIDPSTAAISSAVVSHFTSGCPQVASSMVELTVTNVVGPNAGQLITRLKQIAFWRFDDNGRIIAYDAWIPNLQNFVGKLTHPSVTTFRGGSYMPNETDVFNTAVQICGAQAAYCTGGNQVYNSLEECVATLLAKPYGNYGETWGDNVVCRRVHVLLVPLRPGVHCSHVGPTGGGKCIDVDYNEVYFDDESLFASTGGIDTFRCPSEIGIQL